MRVIIIIVFLKVIFGFLSIAAQCEPKAIKSYDCVSKTIDKAYTEGKKGNYEKQLDLCRKAVDQTRKIQDKYNCFWPNAYLALSDVYYDMGDLEKALLSAREALQFCTLFEMDNCDCMSESKMRIGRAYEDMGQDSIAKRLYLEVLEICEIDGAKLMEALILMNEGDLDRSQGLFHDALAKFDKTESLIQAYGPELLFSQRILGKCNFSRGLIFFQQGNLISSFEQFEMALGQSKNANDKITVAKCYLNLAKISEVQSNIEYAELYYQEALKISKAMKFLELILDANDGIDRIKSAQGKEKVIKI